MSEPAVKRSPYHREILGVTVDVYRILRAFEVTVPAARLAGVVRGSAGRGSALGPEVEIADEVAPDPVARLPKPLPPGVPGG